MIHMDYYHSHTSRKPLAVVDYHRGEIRIYGNPLKSGNTAGADDQADIAKRDSSERQRELNNTERV